MSCNNIDNETRRSHTVRILFCLMMLAGCASSGTHNVATSDKETAGGTARLVQPGDRASVQYVCRLRTGEVVAATDPLADGQPKSKIYVKPEEAGPQLITAISAADAGQDRAVPNKPLSMKRVFAEEIQFRLGQEIVGMKAGESRTAEIETDDAGPEMAEHFIAHLNRVRIQPKTFVMQKNTYEYLTKQSPEVGQEYTYDTDFPGKVESVSDKDVTIRVLVTPGTVKETLFGPARIREEGDNYIMEIDARKGALVRASGMVGRVSYVDDKSFNVDFGNSFGGESLRCDVTVEKIADARLTEGKSATR